jgi:hypothetical protein
MGCSRPDPARLEDNPLRSNGSDAEEIIGYLASLPPPSRFAGFEVQAPILVLPNVFEPEFCEQPIALYESNGGEESGFMRDIDGKTTQVHDHGHKRRRDFTVENPDLVRQIQQRFVRSVGPQLLKAYQYKPTRMERYLVGCYHAEDGGHFGPHRDNTTKGTAHRRFAASVNLNSDFDGARLSFPNIARAASTPRVAPSGLFARRRIAALIWARSVRFAPKPLLRAPKRRSGSPARRTSSRRVSWSVRANNGPHKACLPWCSREAFPHLSASPGSAWELRCRCG